ncbi:MAG: hypothetical protein BMS9Abin02_1322 [Anaerolineae bacterium]|nr:MAG: hypothetical protein BMS9Abin02_1322 [Anaerolineae bacterium]
MAHIGGSDDTTKRRKVMTVVTLEVKNRTFVRTHALEGANDFDSQHLAVTASAADLDDEVSSSGFEANR